MRSSRICFLLAFLPITLWAQKETSLHFNLKKCNEADTLVIAKRTLERGATTLISTMPAKKAKDVIFPLNETSIVIVGMKGDTSTCRFIVQPGEKVDISGKVRNAKQTSLETLQTKGNTQANAEQLAKAKARTMVGNTSLAIEGKNAQGEINNIQFTSPSHRYTLVDFWASWCQPCHAEIPNLKSIYQRYHDKGLRMIGISTDRNVEDWRCSLQEVKEPWENYLDHSRTAIKQFGIKFIPAIFVIDDKGCIIADNLRGKELTNFMDTLFKE